MALANWASRTRSGTLPLFCFQQSKRPVAGKDAGARRRVERNRRRFLGHGELRSEPPARIDAMANAQQEQRDDGLDRLAFPNTATRQGCRVVLFGLEIESILQKGLRQDTGQRMRAMDRKEPRSRARFKGDLQGLRRCRFVQHALCLEPFLQNLWHEIKGGRKASTLLRHQRGAKPHHRAGYKALGIGEVTESGLRQRPFRRDLFRLQAVLGENCAGLFLFLVTAHVLSEAGWTIRRHAVRACWSSASR